MSTQGVGQRILLNPAQAASPLLAEYSAAAEDIKKGKKEPSQGEIKPRKSICGMKVFENPLDLQTADTRYLGNLNTTYR